MDHEIRRDIILKLIHNPRMAYNELRSKKLPSNQFAYHLHSLENEGLIKKHEDGYGLTQEGRKLSTYIEGDTGGKAELPTPTVVVLVRDGKKILCQERLKEPFYGYWGFVSGKMNFGWNAIECALRDLQEETGLIAKNPKLRMVEFMKTKEGDKLLHHHIMFIVEVDEFSGELVKKTHKARHEWLTLEEYKRKKRFPEKWIERILSDDDKLFIIEAIRYMKDGEFSRINTISEEAYSSPTS